jgi:hypothetical protein
MAELNEWMGRAPVFGACRSSVLLLLLLFSSSCRGPEAPSQGEAEVSQLAGGGRHVLNKAQGMWERDGVASWHLVEDLRIGKVEGADPYLFGIGMDIIPDGHGRIWVLDRQTRELRLFDSAGNFLRAIGRTGGGPGEFTGHVCAFPGPAGEIWVEESHNRWQRFDTAGAYLATHPVTSRFGCGTRQWTADGRFFVAANVLDYRTRTSRSFFVIHRMEPSGEIVPGDTVHPPDLPPAPSVTWLAPPGGGQLRSVLDVIPFAHHSRSVLDPTGNFWITDGGGAYAIRRQNPRGDTLLLIEREHAPLAVPGSTRDRAIAEFRREGMTPEGGFNSDAVPRVYPPFDRYYLATDGKLWVRRQLEEAVSGFDVFSADGYYLGPVALPLGLDRMAVSTITSDAIYASIRDELGVSYVVRLSIRRPGTSLDAGAHDVSVLWSNQR